MRIAFVTLGAPEWSAEQCLEAASALGLDGIEWRLVDGAFVEPTFDLDRAAEIRGATERAGLSAVALGSSVDLAVPLAERPEVVAKTRQLLCVADTMGAEFLRVYPGAHPPEAPAVAWLRDAVETLAQDIRATGVRLAFEVHDSRDRPGIRGRSCSAFLAEALRGLPRDLVGVLWDVANPYLEDEPAHVTWQHVKPSLAYLHFKDMIRVADVWTYVHVGDGELPLTEILDWLSLEGFDGWVSFEWERFWIPELDKVEVALPRFVSFMREYGVDA